MSVTPFPIGFSTSLESLSGSAESEGFRNLTSLFSEENEFHDKSEYRKLFSGVKKFEETKLKEKKAQKEITKIKFFIL